MILSISLGRQAVFIDVTGCPCARGIAEELVLRFARCGFTVHAGAIGSTVAARVDCREPDAAGDEERRRWELARACAVGLAATWAVERKIVLAVERREEPLADAGGVFDLKGWRANN
jgi:hypothetical protein